MRDSVIDVSAEVLAANHALVAKLELMLAAMPPPETVPVGITRAAMSSGEGFFGQRVYDPSAYTVFAPGRGGEVAIRIVPPAGTARGLLIHIHGGGWAFGTADGQDRFHRTTCDASGLTVASIDYRLAPEHPFPAPINDVVDSVAWLLESSHLTSGDVFLGGESAGAHLALLAALHLRDCGSIAPITGLDLNFGIFDLSLTPSCRRWGARNLVLSGTQMEWFVSMATPGLSPEARRDPSLSPLYADLSGLPPTRIAVGGLDPLLDDSLFLAARMQAAGADCLLEIYPGAVHGFPFIPGAMTEEFDKRRLAWLTRSHDPPG